MAAGGGDLDAWGGFAVVGLVSMARGVARREGVTLALMFGGRAALVRTAAASWSALGVESVGQRRYREDCKDDSPAEPLYRRRWLIHALSIWGLFARSMMAFSSLEYASV